MVFRFKRIFSVVLTILGLVFVAFYLYTQLPHLAGYEASVYPAKWLIFIISLVFLVLGFLFQTIAWCVIVVDQNKKVDCLLVFESQAATIFSKYVPGKLWGVVGRAAYLSSANWVSESLLTLSKLSLRLQVVSVAAGLLLGFPVVFLWLGVVRISPWVLIFTFTLFFILLALMHARSRLSFKVIFTSLLSWVFWSLGFVFLLASYTGELQLITFCVFSFSAVLGILAFFVPGGLAVREGALASLLIVVGIDSTLAIFIALVARLWFMFGEFVLFSTIFFLRLR